jgi:osmotically-inducible protein OsmY
MTPTKASSVTQRRIEAPPIDSMSLEVERALHGSSHCGLRGVRCRFADGSVTLSGDVVSYYLKQIAQTIVGSLPQVQRVYNQLRVVGLDKNRKSLDR